MLGVRDFFYERQYFLRTKGNVFNSLNSFISFNFHAHAKHESLYITLNSL